MENVAQKLLELYVDLTESQFINIQFKGTNISVLIVSDWFTNQNQDERIDYLIEGLHVSHPEMLQKYKFDFFAYTQEEIKGRPKTPMAS